MYDTRSHSPDRNELTTTSTDLRAEIIRRACVEAAKSAQEVIARNLVKDILSDEFDDDSTPERYAIVNHDPNHPGTQADRLDIYARDAAMRPLQAALTGDLINLDPKHLYWCGEETPDTTIELCHGDYLGRLDALDGTKNSRSYFTGYSSVVCCDMVRTREDRRARHIAGAISTPQTTISWTNTGRFNSDLGRYPHVNGRVFLESQYIPESEIRTRRWSRTVLTAASVAHTTDRYEAVQQILRAFGLENLERFLTAGGTPLAAALLGGDVGVIVEPHHVTLHDSALLLPHQILGGKITDTDGKPMDYLKIYEDNGLNLDPNCKPVPPYMAWGGEHV